MFNILQLHVKYTFNVVQNSLMSIKCICTTKGIIKLQLILQLNEHNDFFWMKNPRS
jgi:hypothetical protein